MLVLYGFLVSCVVLLIASWGFMIAGTWRRGRVLRAGQAARHSGAGLHRAERRVPDLRVRPARGRVRHACASGASRSRRAPRCWRCLFLVNIIYISPGRTALVVIPVLLLIFGFRRFGWKGLVAAPGRRRGADRRRLGGVAVPAAARAVQLLRGASAIARTTSRTRPALRLEFWKKSIGIHRRTRR